MSTASRLVPSPRQNIPFGAVSPVRAGQRIPNGRLRLAVAHSTLRRHDDERVRDAESVLGKGTIDGDLDAADIVAGDEGDNRSAETTACTSFCTPELTTPICGANKAAPLPINGGTWARHSPAIRNSRKPIAQINTEIYSIWTNNFSRPFRYVLRDASAG